MSIFTIIVAGGQGNRMGTEIPKQFLLLAGKPILMHSISTFRTACPGIPVILVLPGGWEERWSELCTIHQFQEAHTAVTGGNTRYQSVKNGLGAIEGTGLVAIHDGARPLVKPETILRLFAEAAIHGSAIPVVSPADSIRWQDGQGNRVIDRNFVKIIQTPQVFELNKLKAAYVQEFETGFTDDATVWEKAGHPVYLADGQADNLKITTREDLTVAEAILLRNIN